MEFGDRSRFSVCAELDDDSGGRWMFGKFCYWIDNRRVGRYERGSSLSDVIIALKWIVFNAGKREDDQMFSIPSDDAYRAIDSSLYGNPDHIESGENTARFDVCPRVEIFSGWKIYLIESGEIAKLLFKKSSDANVSEFMLEKGEFDRSIKLVWDQLNSLYDRELPRGAN